MFDETRMVQLRDALVSAVAAAKASWRSDADPLVSVANVEFCFAISDEIEKEQKSRIARQQIVDALMMGPSA